MEKKRWKLPVILPGLVLLCSLTAALPLKQEEPKPITLELYKKRVSDKARVTLVYFHADWCMVCKKMEPTLEKIKVTYKSNLNILEIDTERNKEVAEHFEISSLPVIMLYFNGEPAWVHIGLISKKDLTAKLNPYVSVP